MGLKRAAGEAGTLYRFKDIKTVSDAKSLIDICLSATQRKTPTVVHPQYKIERIRRFYMRKVKFCQQTFHDKLADINQQFPRVDDIHPFYADLLNVLYDRDHYKLALGQVNAVRGVVDTISKEYVRLLKYADSPYKCKMLKRAALGRMCTAVLKLQNALTYLESVRQNLSRLPAINPFTRTLLLAGHPNVGKSSFMNTLSNANVEVQPFAFTTKSLYLGHFDYAYQKWQLIDTPGVLDRPLSARNSVELSAITALAHLSCTVLFLVDISETCGFSIEDQVKLFNSLKPLLVHKPVMVVLNKVDLRTPEQLSDAEKQLIKSMETGLDCVRFGTCSTLMGLGLDQVKNQACELLLALKLQKKQLSGVDVSAYNIGGKGFFQADVPLNPNRPAFVPEGYLEKKRLASMAPTGDEMEDEPVKRVLERDLMEAEGGAGVFVADDRKHWDLENNEWKYDQLPEFMDGKNIADFIDPNIDAQIAALEAEEAALDAAWNAAEDAPTGDWYKYQEVLQQVFHAREEARMRSSAKKKKNSVIMPRRTVDLDEVREVLGTLGIDSTNVIANMKKVPTLSFVTEADAEHLMGSDADDDDDDDDHMADTDSSDDAHMRENEEASTADGDDESSQQNRRPKSKSKSADRASMLAKRKLRAFAIARRQDGVGELARKKVHKANRAEVVGNEETRLKAEKQKVLADRRFRKPVKSAPRKDQVHEADRFIGTAKPKHLYSGKRTIGKTDRR